MTLGYDQPLYILPFDHRASFEKDLFGFEAPLTPDQTARVSDSKRVVYDGFRAALAQGAPEAAGGILVDEQFGAAILADARAHGYITCIPVEKSGQAEFQFEYGDDWQAHIAAMAPAFIKVLVRYNPEGDAGLNRRQADRLKMLSDYAHTGPHRLMFELLVPMTAEQSGAVGGDQARFDQEVRPGLMVTAIHDLQDAGVEPDIWKIEGLSRVEDCAMVVAAARRDGRDRVGCIVLGRGSDEAGIVAWLKTAAATPGFIGFAIGRTSFWAALVELRDGRITHPVAVDLIAGRYLEWIKVFKGL